jgi:hypothetical protein
MLRYARPIDSWRSLQNNFQKMAERIFLGVPALSEKHTALRAAPVLDLQPYPSESGVFAGSPGSLLADPALARLAGRWVER